MVSRIGAEIMLGNREHACELMEFLLMANQDTERITHLSVYCQRLEAEVARLTDMKEVRGE